MNKVMRLIEAERACCVGHRESFLSADFHQCAARFTGDETLEFLNSAGAVVAFTHDQACTLSRWLVEALQRQEQAAMSEPMRTMPKMKMEKEIRARLLGWEAELAREQCKPGLDREIKNLCYSRIDELRWVLGE